MGTRQLRISDPAQIRKKIQGLAGKKINIVWTDNTSSVGVLLKVNENQITLQNTRLKSVVYPLNTIVELYIDTLD
ncbi:MAG: hypothetical protein JNM57_13760 [Cyclobacteriaceae bacterium]|nr:hypothetical protein [Cyclobacteriaceae bacterium]